MDRGIHNSKAYDLLFQAPYKFGCRMDKKESKSGINATSLGARHDESTGGTNSVASSGQSHNLSDTVQRSSDAWTGGQRLDICRGGCKFLSIHINFAVSLVTRNFPNQFLDITDAKETRLGVCEYQYEKVRQYWIHTAIVYVNTEARFEENYLGGFGTNAELCIFARRKSHVSFSIISSNYYYFLLIDFFLEQRWRYAEYCVFDVGQ